MCKITSSRPVVTKNERIPESAFTGFSSQRKSMRKFVNESLPSKGGKARRGRRNNQVPRAYRQKKKRIVTNTAVRQDEAIDEPMCEEETNNQSNQQDGEVPAVNVVEASED